jgi:hypothetical protein
MLRSTVKEKKTESCDRPLEQRNRRNRKQPGGQTGAGKASGSRFLFFKKLSGSRFSQCSFGILLPRLGIWIEAHKFTNYDETERESGASWVTLFFKPPAGRRWSKLVVSSKRNETSVETNWDYYWDRRAVLDGQSSAYPVPLHHCWYSSTIFNVL